MAHIYEHIRTRGHEPLHFEEHFAQLEALSAKYFTEPISFPPQYVRESIISDAKRRHLSSTGMNCALVMLFHDGAIHIQTEWMMYDRFSLRALHPNCYPVCISGEIILDNTSVKEQLLGFQYVCTSEDNKNDVAIWHNEQGEVLAIDGAPVVAVFEDEIIFSNYGQSVEFDLAYELLSKGRSDVAKGVIKLENLSKAKELLFIDHRGVTAVNRLYGSTIYMDITAEKIATLIAEAE